MILRVAEEGKLAFQLRKGELGISAFDSELVEPALTSDEILTHFRPGSVLVGRNVQEINSKGLQVVGIAGADVLPIRLRTSHVEIRPSVGMSRTDFKRALSELE